MAPEPGSFPHRIAKGAPVRAVVVGAQVAHVLDSVREATERGWIEPVLVGPDAAIRAVADNLGWTLTDVEIHPADGETAIAERAIPLVADPACGMIVKGHIPTSTMFRALFRCEANYRAGGRLVHVFHLAIPGREQALAISDGAINIAPDLETKQDILRALIDLLRATGVARPRIAILAASEKIDPRVPATVDAARLCEWSQEKGLESEVYGPVAFDVAMSPEAAALKDIDHPVAGRADALLVPNIETGNSLTKALVWFASACAAGVVLGGRVPATLPSRSDGPAARLAAMALARIVGQKGPEATVRPGA